jgi:hypothetical protein
MKNILLITIAVATMTSSCRKIIDIELDEANKRTTIDSKIELGTNDVNARITKSGNFFGSSSNPALTDATVTLNDGSTNYPLINIGNGNYKLSGFTSLGGQNYSMKVTQGGVTYDATTSMPNLIEIDTVIATYQAASTFNDEGYLLNILFQDPAAVTNYYRIEVDIAGERYGSIDDRILLDDGLTNGNLINFPLFGADVAQLGDTVIMYLRSIDKQSFDYFTAIDEVLNGNAATPASPKSNFNNNALGNFSAFATDTMTIVVQ